MNGMHVKTTVPSIDSSMNKKVSPIEDGTITETTITAIIPSRGNLASTLIK